MKLLLDTHIVLWSIHEPGRLIRPVAEALEGTENEKWLSPVSTWEILLLVEKGRLKMASALDEWFSELRGKAPLRDAPLTHDVLLETARVRLSGPDPADRFLDRKSTRLNSSHIQKSRMPSSA